MRASSLLCTLTFLGSALCLEPQVQAAPNTPETAESLPEKDGLKISISPTYKREEGRGGIGLEPSDPYIDIVLQNVSSKPLNIFEEWNSSGAYNLTLRITEVDGKTLDNPIIIHRSGLEWGGNVGSLRLIEPGEAVVREVRLHVPAQIFNPAAPKTDSDLKPHGYRYWQFPVPDKDRDRQIILSAVFANDLDHNEGGTKVWTGQIASPPTDYRVYWSSDLD